VTNGAKPPPPQQQQQVRQRSALGDISNRAAPGSSAGAKKDELPPVECLHASDPLPLASFDLSSCARPEAVARAVDEHRAPVFGASARDVGGVAPLVLEQVPVPSPWAFGSSPGPMPTFRGVPPSPFGLEAEQLGRKPAGTSHDGSERCSSSQVAPRARLGPARPASPPPPPPPPPPPTHTHTHTVPRSAPFPPQRPLPQAGVGVAQDGAGHDLRDAGARALATAGHHRRRLGRGYGARGLRLRGGDVWGGWVGGWGVPGSFVGCSTACGECVPRARDDVGRSRHLAARRTHTLEAQSCVARWPCAHCVRDTRYLILFYSGLQHPTPKRATGRSRPSKRRAGDLATKIAFHERLHRLLHIVLAAGSCAPDRARCAARPAWLHDCWLVAGATSPQRRLPASERLRARAPASNTSAPQACTAGAPPAQLGPTVISGAAVRRGRAHAEQAPTELCRAGAT
jgi:hypothetical protein